MFAITKQVEFDAGHRVPLHDSMCRNPHGHRYTVVAEVSSVELRDTGPMTGMVWDFGHLKRLLQVHVHDRFDHGFIVWKGDFAMRESLGAHGTLQHDGMERTEEPWKVIVVPYHPTAENLARDIYQDLAAALLGHPVVLSAVHVWETPSSCATYTEQP